MEIHPYSAFPKKIPHIIYRFSHGQKRSSRGIFNEISFSSYPPFAIGRKQTEFHLWKLDLKTRNWSADDFKNTSPQWVVYMSPRYSHVTPISGYFFDSCQLIIAWMSNTKLNTDSICLGFLASECDISHPLTRRGGRRYVRTILSEPKFLECIDNQILLPMVLRCARELR